MTITATPIAHNIWNALDEQGLLLGLSRLPSERNAEYKRRLADVMVHRASSTKRGLINGITRELGLEIKRTLQIQMSVDSDGAPILPCPAIIFDDPNCVVYSDYVNKTIAATFNRFDSAGSSFTLGQLVAQINAIPYFNATLLTGIDDKLRANTIFDQSTIGTVDSEDIAQGSHHIQLGQEHLIDETVAIRSSTLVNRVSAENLVVNTGDYYINLVGGILIAADIPEGGASIRYQYVQLNTIVESSPVILHDIHSETFKPNLFQIDKNGEPGLPSPYGADIINEILSLYPTAFGK